MSLIEKDIHYSTSFDEACERFVVSVENWIRDCISEYKDEAATNVHDQCTYTTAWLPVLKHHPQAEAIAFLKEARDKIRDHFNETDQWYHGYWRSQEVHHGTEHFELFLGTLLQLDPGDPESIRQIVDAAEHLGNFSDDVPAWYDEERNLYRSMYFGTEVVKEQAGLDLNVPDFFRCINVALIAWRASNERRFLTLASEYGRQWANGIMANENIPAALTKEGPVYSVESDGYRRFAGMAPKGNELMDRAENLLASNAPQSLLLLWQETGELIFKAAAQKLIDALQHELNDPDAGAAVAAMTAFHDVTGDRRYEDAILTAASDLSLPSTLSLEHSPTVLPSKPDGIGKRSDQPNWYDDGEKQKTGPVLLLHAALLSHDNDKAAAALDIARTQFEMVREVYPHGRDHGCSARSVSAIARGHGRCNHCGVVTQVLAPALSAAW